MKYLLIRTIAVLVASYITRVGVPLLFSTFPYIVNTTWTAFLVAIVLAIAFWCFKSLLPQGLQDEIIIAATSIAGSAILIYNAITGISRNEPLKQ